MGPANRCRVRRQAAAAVSKSVQVAGPVELAGVPAGRTASLVHLPFFVTSRQSVHRRSARSSAGMPAGSRASRGGRTVGSA